MPVKSNLDNFIAKAIKLHGDKYSYEHFNYRNTRTKSAIKCPIHGVFMQSPNTHLNGSGCPKCGGRMKIDTEEFVRRAKSVHGDKYDYSLTNYQKIKINVVITCPEHGDFEQRPDLHLRGHGCPICAVQARTDHLYDDKESFVEKAKSVHGDKYDYSKVDYKSSAQDVVLLCPIHGEFKIKPRAHICGTGCRKCSRKGFNRDIDSYVYVARSKDGKYEKIGVTNNPNSRVDSLKSQTPFEISVDLFIRSDEAKEIESHVKNHYQNAGLSGFNGCTEWFDSGIDLLDHVVFMVEMMKNKPQ